MEMWNFLKAVGLKESLLDREVHEGEKLAHYARACTDIVFTYPFGTQELLGVAARGEYDLQQHAQASGESLEYQAGRAGRTHRQTTTINNPRITHPTQNDSLKGRSFHESRRPVCCKRAFMS